MSLQNSLGRVNAALGSFVHPSVERAETLRLHLRARYLDRHGRIAPRMAAILASVVFDGGEL